MKKAIYLFLALAFTAASFQSCKTAKTAAYSPVGIWEYVINDTPMGDAKGSFTLAMDGDQPSLTMNGGELGSAPLKNFKMDGNNIVSGSFDYQGYSVEIRGTFEGESFTGTAGAAGYSFPMTASRTK